MNPTPEELQNRIKGLELMFAQSIDSITVLSAFQMATMHLISARLVNLTVEERADLQSNLAKCQTFHEQLEGHARDLKAAMHKRATGER